MVVLRPHTSDRGVAIAEWGVGIEFGEGKRMTGKEVIRKAIGCVGR